jgi:hypothetical protein
MPPVVNADHNRAADAMTPGVGVRCLNISGGTHA